LIENERYLFFTFVKTMRQTTKVLIFQGKQGIGAEAQPSFSLMTIYLSREALKHFYELMQCLK